MSEYQGRDVLSRQKYGPAVLGQEPIATTDPVAAVAESAPVAEKLVLGPGVVMTPEGPRATADTETLGVRIRLLGRELRAAETIDQQEQPVDPERAAAVRAQLAAIAEQEYGRPDGPRRPIMMRLNGLGIGKPEQEGPRAT